MTDQPTAAGQPPAAIPPIAIFAGHHIRTYSMDEQGTVYGFKGGASWSDRYYEGYSEDEPSRVLILARDVRIEGLNVNDDLLLSRKARHYDASQAKEGRVFAPITAVIRPATGKINGWEWGKTRAYVPGEAVTTVTELKRPYETE